MTSDRQQCANRANAKSSTGPKSAAGKARAAQNAFRHGLNVSVLSDPLFAPEVEAMARKICGLDTDAATLEGARRIAEAQIDLNRVRAGRRRLLTRLLVDPYYQPKEVNRQRFRLLNWVLGGCRPRNLPVRGQVRLDGAAHDFVDAAHRGRPAHRAGGAV